MNPLHVAALFAAFAGSALANGPVAETRLVADPFAVSPDARFRIYPTHGTTTQLALDTETGALWQVELPGGYVSGAQATQPGRYALVEPAAEGRVGRFALVERHAGKYTLIDQDTGALWDISISVGRADRSKATRLDEVRLPDVETP